MRGQQIYQDECIGPFGNGNENENGKALHDLLLDHDMGAVNTHRKDMDVSPFFVISVRSLSSTKSSFK
ncbi:unnamed protein product, partial [Prorocentrum cordatum]